MASLSKQHTINFLLNEHYSKKAKPHCMATAYLMSKQYLKIKSPIMNDNNYLNEVFPSFDSLNKELSLYQLYSITISNDLRAFFNKNSINLTSFWNCHSSIKWFSHLLVDKKSKHLRINPIFTRKSSWEFSRKEKCSSIVHKWQMYFQASEYKGRNFLDLNDNNN